MAVPPLRIPGASARGAGPVRAWLRRPGALRLESVDGTLLHSTTGINDSRDGLYISATRKSWLLPAHLVTPVYDDGGLVRRRPEAAYGEPSFGNGRFAAALDPVELAGNAPVPLEFPSANAVEVSSPCTTSSTRAARRWRRWFPPTPATVRWIPRPRCAGPAPPGSGSTPEPGVCVASEPLDGGAGARALDPHPGRG